MVAGILGQKLGMTQVFSDDGTVTPATVIKAGPCVVVQRKTVERDGYDAVQLGLVEGKPAAVNKPTAGHYKKANVPPTRLRREVPLVAGSDPPAEGEEVVASLFADGDRVDVIGVSRGKGFQGVMKRHGFGGGRARRHYAPHGGGVLLLHHGGRDVVAGGGRRGADQATARTSG